MPPFEASACERFGLDGGLGYINTETSTDGPDVWFSGTCRQSVSKRPAKLARQKAASVAQGANPSVERKKKRTAGTVLEVVEAYLVHAKERQRSRSFSETERHLRIHAASLHHDRVETVRRGDIAALLGRIAESSGPIAANRLRAALSAMWTWGLRTGLIDADSNPVAFTVRQPETARDRTLSGAELKAIWDATINGKDYSRIVRLCLLTGCRREEIGRLRWDEIQGDRIVFGPDRMKGNLAHEIALLPMISSTLPQTPRRCERLCVRQAWHWLLRLEQKQD